MIKINHKNETVRMSIRGRKVRMQTHNALIIITCILRQAGLFQKFPN